MNLDPRFAACETEQIQSPGAIQDWGALLIADCAAPRGDPVIRHASENLPSFLGVRPDDAIGARLAECLGPSAAARIVAGAQREDAGGLVTTLPASGPGLPNLAVSAHRLGSLLYVEIEPDFGAPPVTRSTHRILQVLRAADSFEALFNAAATELREVTGFDRVMVYRFDPDRHGEVMADCRAPEMESLLGLNYPAQDIPPQAWRIFTRLQVRVIANSHATPVALLPGTGPGGSPDLSLCALRLPSPCHSEYLRNMGSHATATVALLVDGELWGLLACHHRTKRHLPPDWRALCEMVGQVTSLMICTLRDGAIRRDAADTRSRLDGMNDRLGADHDDLAMLAGALAAEGPELLALGQSEGVLVRLGGRTIALGLAPSGETADRLIDALLGHTQASAAPPAVFALDTLREAIAADLLDEAGAPAGAMLLPLNHKPGDAVVWLRPAQPRIVRWSGDPRNPMQFDPVRRQLVPRTSFSVWQQELQHRSLPWTAAQREAARGLGTMIDTKMAGYAESMRLAREVAERATRAKSEFLATMSHEIRSPMSGLLGVLELLRTTELNAEQNRMACMAHNSAHMLLAVLNDILDFSKIEAGALSIAMEPVELHALLHDLAQPHGVAVAQKGIPLYLTIDSAVPDRVTTDKLRLRQILGNLLSNAAKFTAAGEISLLADVTGDGEHPALRFRVIDTGIGMSEDVLGRLFAPFMQADGSTTRNFGGTGLGLCISRQLAHLLDGDLAVTSKLGVGSEFTFTMPLIACSAQAAEAAPRAAPSIALSAAGKRVLVVDDDATIRWLSQRQLEKLGFKADAADDGTSGLSRLAEFHYDLVLTDCHMPRMDGVSLTRAIRASDNAAIRCIPVIGLTADVTENQRDLCLAAGMSDLAIKPLTVERLSQLLRRHLPAASAPPHASDEAAALRDVPFDEQIYLSIFPPGDPDGVAWISDWLRTARDDLRDLVALMEPPDAADPPGEAIGNVAHRLAGSSFSVGAMKLGHAARALEFASAAASAGDLRTARATLSQELEAAGVAIAAFLLRGEQAADADTAG